MSKYILAIESSCDDSCICVMDLDYNIKYEKNISQIDLHNEYGGVVPELASRSHLQYLQVILKDLAKSIDINDIVAVSPTFAPGLIGGLLTAVGISKGICQMHGKKFIPIHHLQGHLESVNIGKKEHVAYPSLTLLVSGGHCQFIYAKAFGDYEIIGKTLDDSVGEAFDKSGKIIGLRYPAGPEIEKNAINGRLMDEIGKPMTDKTTNFSFSGFKTNVLNFVNKNRENLNDPIFFKNLCYTIQSRLAENLAYKTRLAIDFVTQKYGNFDNFILCGGVSANQTIIKNMQNICGDYNIKLHHPPLKYSMDNAAMIAAAGVKNFKLGHYSSLDLAPQNRFNIQDLLSFYEKDTSFVG